MQRISETDYELLHELGKRQARKKFRAYLAYSNVLYDMQWFHKKIADACQRVIDGEIKKLMIFIPPQFGKSEITSRKLPAYVLGLHPTTKIVLASYSASLAETFGRDVRRTIESDNFNDVFQGITGGGFINTQGLLETNAGGFLKTIGVGGSLTGTPADLAIIDDPVKDAKEAYSQNARDTVWEWYINVLQTRLHNSSRVIFIMTRWHDDDLAGRLLKKEPGQWEVISIPAICEEITEEDPREIGESLWESKHSKEKLLNVKNLSERTFAALYQQHPSIEGGNIIKSDWFKRITFEEFNRLRSVTPYHFFVDTAFTEKTSNDPTGIIATCKVGYDLFIVSGSKVLMEFPELINWMPIWCRDHGYSYSSTVRVEPKANGKSVVQQLKRTTGLNIVETPSPSESKETRLYVASPSVSAGRVYLVDGGWNDSFIIEVCSFPAATHDEYVDLLCYAIDYHLKPNAQNLSNFASQLH